MTDLVNLKLTAKDRVTKGDSTRKLGGFFAQSQSRSKLTCLHYLVDLAATISIGL
jgi:hypothetical protein